MDTTGSTIRLRKSYDRGHADHGWLNSYHTFSFADYYDPEHMGFRSLRVINDDVVAPGKGFGTHPHRDMEIISFIVEGALEHKDSMGNGSVIRAGNVQRMTAGTGVTHSEFNPSPDEPVRLLQIWILPNKRGLEPSYEEIEIAAVEAQSGLKLIASPDGRKGSVTIHQDAFVYAGRLAQGENAVHQTNPDRGLWLQMIDGEVETSGHTLAKGDGLSIENAGQIEISASSSARFLLFDLK